MIFHDVTQGGPEWHELRRGVPTSSAFSRIMTPKSRKLSSQVDDYIAELIGERMSIYGAEHAENYMSNAMRHGADTEAEARRYLAMHANLDITNGGFCLTDDGRWGASPDGLVGEDGVVEIKCPMAKTQVRYLLDRTLPDEYLCQVHGQLIVTGRKYVQFVSYHPGLPPFLCRIDPDEFTTELRVCLEIFHAKYQEVLLKVKGM